MEIAFFFLVFLLAWIAFGALIAAGAGLVLGWIAEFFTRNVKDGRREAIRAIRWSPLKCFIWVAIVFMFYSVINVALRHNISLRGDAWTCQFPNGYGILMIDSTDSGFIYDTRIQGFGHYDGIGDQEGTVVLPAKTGHLI